jgi:pimeloyl-ACP methyl ester carboxylesterase
MPFFHSNGIDFHYEELGSGPPIVICHGLTGDLTAPKDLVGELPGNRLILVDSRAHGLTQPLGGECDLTFSQFARDLRDLLDHLAIERAVVGGISMGAGVAARFAMDSPDRVRGLVMIRPAWLDQPFPANLDLPVLVARLFEEHGSERWRTIFDQHPLVQLVQAQEPSLIGTMRRQFDAPLAVERRARLIRVPGDCPLTDWHELSGCAAPAIVIGSENDWLHPLEVAETWASRLPNAQLRLAATKSVNFPQHARDVRGNLRELLDSR